MIIRSQRKGMILNMDCIAKIYVDDVLQENTKIFKYGIVADKEIIAVYSTEEKAVKVLDMMQEAYSRMEDIKCGAVQAQKYDSFCFQMPADEDVEV